MANSDESKMTAMENNPRASRVPLPLWIATVVVVAEAVILSSVSSAPLPEALGAICITGLLAWLLLRGSRIAWILLVAGSASLLVGPWLFGQPLYTFLSGVVILVCMFIRSVLRYVWGGVRTSESRQHVERLAWTVLTVDLRRIPRIAVTYRHRLHQGLFYLGFGVLLATPVTIRLRSYHEGLGPGLQPGDIIWGVLAVLYLLAKVLFVVCALLAVLIHVAFRNGTPRIEPGPKDAPE
jgi:hypothetical protein